MKKKGGHRLENLFRAGKGRFETETFDPETMEAVIRGSICTSEKVAGFKNKETGKFTEIMLIRSHEDIRRFKETYHLDDVKTEY